MTYEYEVAEQQYFFVMIHEILKITLDDVVFGHNRFLHNIGIRR